MKYTILEIFAMMARYRGYAYLIEAIATMSIWLAVLLPWHEAYGRGIEIMALAIDTVIPFGLDPFNPDYIPVSQWWLIWIPLLGSFVMGLRAASNYLYINAPPEHNPWVIGFILFWMGLGYAWFGVNFRDGLLIGYWLCAIPILIQVVTILLDLWLPEHTHLENYINRLPPDHPDRVLMGAYRVCPICGEFNAPEARTCRDCHSMLLPPA